MGYQEVPNEHTQIVNLKEPGEYVEGFLLAIRQGKYGKLADIMGLDNKPGTIQLSVDLINKLNRVPIRTLVKIELVERKPLEDGNDLKIFRVLNDTATSYDIWSIQQQNKSVPEEKRVNDEVPF